MKFFRILFFFIAAAIPQLHQIYAKNPELQNKNELQSINEVINSLEKKLSEKRQQTLNEEVKAQPYMFDNWHEFADDIRVAEENEKEILAIKKRLKNLYEEKNRLSNPPSSESSNKLII